MKDNFKEVADQFLEELERDLDKEPFSDRDKGIVLASFEAGWVRSGIALRKKLGEQLATFAFGGEWRGVKIRDGLGSDVEDGVSGYSQEYIMDKIIGAGGEEE